MALGTSRQLPLRHRGSTPWDRDPRNGLLRDGVGQRFHDPARVCRR
jgi:hypothetical protein